MKQNRARPALCRIVIPALVVAVAVPIVATAAQTPQSALPSKSARAQEPLVPSVPAQTQIARLRQAADQLRLLAHQPHPTIAAPTDHEEHARHRQWLQEAGPRVRTLADNWEQRLAPDVQGKRAVTQARDVNAFFAAQTAGLQSRLDRESAATEYQSPLVRAARDTARVVIGHMH